MSDDERVEAAERRVAHFRRLLAEEQATVAEIERVCARQGYDPRLGLPVSDWLASRLKG